LTLEGLGVPKLGNPVARGDHLIRIKIDIPTKIGNEEREALEKLKEKQFGNTAKGGIGDILGGIFGNH
jgi:molecular chaperone DnaJ